MNSCIVFLFQLFCMSIYIFQYKICFWICFIENVYLNLYIYLLFFSERKQILFRFPLQIKFNIVLKKKIGHTIAHHENCILFYFFIWIVHSTVVIFLQNLKFFGKILRLKYCFWIEHNSINFFFIRQIFR